jgi:hypothetical protein
MPDLSYVQPGLTLSISPTPSQAVRDLQRDLRALGYHRSTIDGVFGPGTAKSVSAIQFDLLHNDGSSPANNHDGAAPVAVMSYNSARVTDISESLDQNLAACIADMLNDDAFPKLPFSSFPLDDNQKALQAAASLAAGRVPFPFFYQTLIQESGGQHFHIPRDGDLDTFVTVGLDTNDKSSAVHITSRGYGIGQFTLFHHPPTANEVASFISDPLGNVEKAIGELRRKFDNYVNGPIDVASDRVAEAGRGALRPCRHDPADQLYMRDCVNCLKNAGTQEIVANQTPTYEGSPDTYEHTQYHAGSYHSVPVRKNIPCDWPYAIRRFNGAGPNSYDYQAEMLLKVLNTTAVAVNNPGTP